MIPHIITCPGWLRLTSETEFCVTSLSLRFSSGVFKTPTCCVSGCLQAPVIVSSKKTHQFISPAMPQTPLSCHNLASSTAPYQPTLRTKQARSSPPRHSLRDCANAYEWQHRLRKWPMKATGGLWALFRMNRDHGQSTLIARRFKSTH